MKRLAIAGAGDLGCQFLNHVKAAKSHCVVGFFDDTVSPGEPRAGLPVLGPIEDIREAYSKSVFDEMLIGIGYRHMAFRQTLFETLEDHVPFAKIIHPSCIVDPSARIGKGTVMYPGALLDADVRVGRNVVVNIGASIAHDSTIGDHCFIAPRVAIAGFVTIGNRAILGINSSIVDNVYLGDDVRLGAGTVVTKSLCHGGLYVGVPSRFVRGIVDLDTSEGNP